VCRQSASHAWHCIGHSSASGRCRRRLVGRTGCLPICVALVSNNASLFSAFLSLTVPPRCRGMTTHVATMTAGNICGRARRRRRQRLAHRRTSAACARSCGTIRFRQSRTLSGTRRCRHRHACIVSREGGGNRRRANGWRRRKCVSISNATISLLHRKHRPQWRPSAA
jgi:hypothetical protein